MQRADKLMYDAKDERVSHIHLQVTLIEHGELVETPDAEERAASAPTRSVARELPAKRPLDRRRPRIT
jgi:hypothetical protein